MVAPEMLGDTWPLFYPLAAARSCVEEQVASGGVMFAMRQCPPVRPRFPAPFSVLTASVRVRPVRSSFAERGRGRPSLPAMCDVHWSGSQVNLRMLWNERKRKEKKGMVCASRRKQNNSDVLGTLVGKLIFCHRSKEEKVAAAMLELIACASPFRTCSRFGIRTPVIWPPKWPLACLNYESFRQPRKAAGSQCKGDSIPHPPNRGRGFACARDRGTGRRDRRKR